VFSLDVFDSASSLTDILIGLFMHNIPVFILVAVLIVSWKHEIVGAIVFILFGVSYIGITLRGMLANSFEWGMLLSILIIAGPSFFIGILFYLNWKAKKKRKKK
jgi:uncharacterized membrane protein